uniref:Uncharacterized protein n=1 Tax=Chlorocebus sabaeus TaxID=60711 RepID=A0A0D9S1G7_CHLSB
MRLHATCLTLLDLVYLLHEPIYESLLRASIENSTPSQLQGEKFISVKEDFMLLAVGIIAASAFIQNHECWSQVCTTEQDRHGENSFNRKHFTHQLKENRRQPTEVPRPRIRISVQDLRGKNLG